MEISGTHVAVRETVRAIAGQLGQFEGLVIEGLLGLFI